MDNGVAIIVGAAINAAGIYFGLAGTVERYSVHPMGDSFALRVDNKTGAFSVCGYERGPKVPFDMVCRPVVAAPQNSN